MPSANGRNKPKNPRTALQLGCHGDRVARVDQSVRPLINLKEQRARVPSVRTPHDIGVPGDVTVISTFLPAEPPYVLNVSCVTGQRILIPQDLGLGNKTGSTNCQHD
jgi:hypothetical protein